MRKLGTMVGLALVAIACATGGDMVDEMLDSGVPDAGAQPTPKPVGKFVGYTSEGYSLYPSDGEGGLFNTYAACQTDFGNNARICTVTDVLGTIELPAPPPADYDSDTATSGGAWLIANNLDEVPSCWRGSSSSDSAPVLQASGQINFDDGCGTRRVLACCTVE
jgi:hypothetical protein